MAVQLAGVRNGLIGLGFSLAAATEITTAQGYDSLTALAELTDTTITDLIYTVRKPGGMIPNPGANPVPANIPNPGINVGHRAITNLKLGVFVARHYLRTSRPLDDPVGTLDMVNIRPYLGLKTSEDKYENPAALPVLAKIDRIREHI